MQSGTTSLRYRFAEESEAATRVQTAQNVAQPSGKSSDFFGEDGLTFRDVLDAVNPLNHIPIVSDIFQSATGHQPSTASQLAGGTLIGGPVGFVASLATSIFEAATGNSPAKALYAALAGEETTQVASLAEEADTMAVASAASPANPPSANVALTLASLDPETQAALQAAPSSKRSAKGTAPAGQPIVMASASAETILDLYGNSSSAHASYKKAQMLPYLREVSTSKVL